MSHTLLHCVALHKSVFCVTQSFYSLPVQVSVYQVLDITKKNITQDRKLLSSRLIPIHSSGWEVFTITQAVSVHCPKRTYLLIQNIS